MRLRRLSESGLRLLQGLEGFRAEIYPDEGGKETIGFGHLLTVEDKRLRRYTEPMTRLTATALLRDDVARIETGVSLLLPEKLDLEAHQLDALVCFAYNAGLAHFGASTLLQLVRIGAPSENVVEQFERWIFVRDASGKPRPSEGLKRRRAVEARLWRGGAT